jgi:type IV pilus secretin PilQ/predicted competence protein
MRGKKYLPVLSVMIASLVASGFADHGASPASIKQITIQPGVNHTDVIFESTSPLTVLNSRYDMEKPAALIMEIDNLKVDAAPPIQAQPGSKIKNIDLINLDSSRISAVVELTEKMPYSVITGDQHFVVEFTHYQKPDTEYSVGDTKQAAIEHLPTINMSDLLVEQNEGAVQVTAELTGKTIPHVFALKNPHRLIVDLHNTLSQRPPLNYPIYERGIKSLRTAQFKVSNPYTIARLVFDLEEPGLFSIDQTGNRVHITFPADTPAEPAPPAEAFVPADTGSKEEISPTAAPFPPLKDTDEPEIEESNLSAHEEILKENEKEILPAEKKTPEASKEKILPSDKKVKNPVEERQQQTKIEKPNGDSAQSEIGQTEQFIPQTISDTEKKYAGELISPKFLDADLRDVILVITEIAGLNVIFDPGVRGSVTCDFTDIPWDQFLDLVLKTNDMGKTIEGNVLRIAPITVLTQEQDRVRKLEESQELAGPLQVKTFTLSYSKAGEIQSLLQSKISSRGEIIIDNRTNTLVITDVREKMVLIEKLIELFDTATPQVSIEARIVEATSTFVRNLGIQWGWRGIADPFYGNQTSLKFPNKALIDGAMVPEGIVTKGIGGPLGGYAINLPAPAFTSAIGLSFANILDTFRLDMALSALETSGSGRIISAPKITTQNNQDADIIQGRQIPVQTVANFTVTTRYINAALELSARPQITAEGTIIMEIEIRNNAADFANLVNGIPPIITQSANTTVMVSDGGTTVIGGIYRTEDSITREKVPLLHKIPILGNLFRSFARTKQNRELLIFITPRIIK